MKPCRACSGKKNASVLGTAAIDEQQANTEPQK
jgi:hypothetical protein